VQARTYEPLLSGRTGPYVAAANSQTRDAHVRDASGRRALETSEPYPHLPSAFPPNLPSRRDRILSRVQTGGAVRDRPPRSGVNSQKISPRRTIIPGSQGPSRVTATRLLFGRASTPPTLVASATPLSMAEEPRQWYANLTITRYHTGNRRTEEHASPDTPARPTDVLS